MGAQSAWSANPTRRQHIRTQLAATLPQPCHICGHPVEPGTPWDVDHLIPRGQAPDLTWRIDNCAPTHTACNRKRGNGLDGKRRAASRGSRSLPATTHPGRSDQKLTRGVTVSPGKPRRSRGTVAPRLESPRGRGWSSWGDDVADVAREYLGVELKPWQRYAASRITEHRDGRLRWPYALLTVGRQQGKTVLLASLIAWRILRGPALFGEPQQILSMAQGIKIAHLVFDLVMRDRLDAQADKVVWQLGNESARFGEGYWRIVSNHLKSVTGFSSSLVVADEAWNIDRDVIVSGVMPQTIQRAQPQLVMCSTAGDSRSDLVAHYRDMAQQHRSEVLLLEWSAPPDSDPDDEDAWRWSLPDWKPREYRRLRQVTDETAWRMQYLNQWVINRDGWVSLAQWLPLRDTGSMPAGGVVVVGPSRDYSAWAGVHAAVDEHGVTHVRQMRHTVPDTVWRWAHDLGDEVALHVNVGTRFRDPDWLRPVAGTVGARELHAAIRLVQQRIRDGGVRHDGSELLTEHVLRASVTDLPGGTTVMRSPTGEPIDLTELMCVAVELAGRTMRGPVLV